MFSKAGAKAAMANRVSELRIPAKQRDQADEQQIREGPARQLDRQLELAGPLR